MLKAAILNLLSKEKTPVAEGDEVIFILHAQDAKKRNSVEWKRVSKVTLALLQELVGGGNIERIPSEKKGFIALCNEDGLLMWSHGRAGKNALAASLLQQTSRGFVEPILGFHCGNVVLCRETAEGFCGLSDADVKEMEKCLSMFNLK